MYFVVTAVILLVCFLLVLVVLVQNSKGGGLVSNFAGSNQIMGVRRTADFLEKSTWVLAISLLVLSLAASAAMPGKKTDRESLMKEQIENAVDPTALPNFGTPATTPAQNTDKPASDGKKPAENSK
jgi:preprotein translocase subunit SecG